MRPGRLLALAWKSIAEHKLRSLLTVSGVVFGVAAVVTMLAIGEGESQAAQEQIRRMGSNNLLLASVKPSEPESGTSANARVLSYGLLEKDLLRIQSTVPEIDLAVPRRDVPVDVKVLARALWIVSRYWTDHLQEQEGVDSIDRAQQERGFQHHFAVLLPYLTAPARRSLESSFLRMSSELAAGERNNA